MERILIIGGNGSGKTTLSRELSKKLNLPLIHLDVLYWRDNWESASNDEFDELLLKELTKPKWIIDGNITRTLPVRLEYCDTVIYMDFPRTKCICGAVKRLIKNYGTSRPDMGGYCPEIFTSRSIEFFKTIWNFHYKNRKRFYDMIDASNDINVIVLKNRKQVSEFLQEYTT